MEWGNCGGNAVGFPIKINLRVICVVFYVTKGYNKEKRKVVVIWRHGVQM